MNDALQTDEYRRRRERLKRSHEIRETYEELSWAYKVKEFVDLEIRVTAGSHAALTVSRWAYSWLTDRNPYYLHLAFAYCHENGISPTPTLWDLMGDFSNRQINGEEFPGTPEKVKKEQALESIFQLMANLRFRGVSLSDAAGMAAVEFAARHPELHAPKASTLNRYYSARYRRPMGCSSVNPDSKSLEEQIFDVWRERGVPEQWDEFWSTLSQNLPEVPPEVQGNRRN